MKAITVLMYHAIDHDGAIGADAHYSVEPARFARQLQLIKQHGGYASSVLAQLDAQSPHHDRGPNTLGARRPVCLTFDDGHVSNGHAAEQIARHGGQADFFINPSMVGKPGFLSWAELREMADMGMSIQSHGMNHRYLDQLSAAEVRAELDDSRAAIEDAIGLPVTIYAPAGGRMPAGFMSMARQSGYQAVCSSRVGLWQPAQAAVAGHALELPRLAMLQGTHDGQFLAWITQKPSEMLKQQLRYRLLRLSKQLLGNQGHERLRAWLLPGRHAPINATSDTGIDATADSTIGQHHHPDDRMP
ncbi:MAG: polysaccharide deacetylase family protein [Lautropia sp.]|nr:polysaccharide deacetylase family protein [Lautropia sp.]